MKAVGAARSERGFRGRITNAGVPNSAHGIRRMSETYEVSFNGRRHL
jgi:hypothetical protein